MRESASGTTVTVYLPGTDALRVWGGEYALWASEIVDEALLYHAGDPLEAAQADVVACEHEAREID